ncbi:hypothetical protein [Microvirga solisilvae]|uniref:hypothetical protein n=1 Tax=Microvirga solisilvae TaxID=2919498 RepID=UPI001FAEB7C0|nr:hypothetical protein [Microvirga solisilvae]
MSSSISNSKNVLPKAGTWRGFATALVATAAAVTVAILALIYAIDPYDSGRSILSSEPGVRPQGPRTANASRGRDPAFDAAIFGNSRIQLISPERLSKATGLAFVQLSVPGSGPKEHLTLIDWFLRHRKEPPKALVVSIDETWCTSDPELTNEQPFPFWLYSSNPLEYAGGLLRFDVLEEVPSRLAYLLGLDAERARADGYWDYEAEKSAQGAGAGSAARRELQQTPYANARLFERDPQEGRHVFPAAARIKEVAAALPEGATLVLVTPPLYKNSLPPAGTEQAFRLQACRDEIVASAVSGHSRTVLVDWRVDRPEIRNPALFFDRVHYRRPIAQAMEADIVEVIRRYPSHP